MCIYREKKIDMQEHLPSDFSRKFYKSNKSLLIKIFP